MNMYAKKCLPLCVAVCALTLLNSQSYGYGTISGGPVNPAGDTVADSSYTGVLERNLARNVVSTTAGYDSVTSARVNMAEGTLQAYAEYTLDQAQMYASLPEAGSSKIGSIVSLDGRLIGPSNVPAGQTVDMTFEMALHGSFGIDNGTPTLLLAGDLSLTRIQSLFPPAGNIYQSAFSFISSSASAPGEVDTSFDGVVSPLLGGPSTDFSGATVDILSTNPDDLNAILRLTVPVSAGDSLMIFGTLIAAAGPSPDPNNDADPTVDFSVLAASGYVDGMNTAQLKIFLPEGYSLEGTDPLLNSFVTNYPVVPLPASGLMLAPALLGLFGLARRATGRSKVQ